jgi:hypothetical protein
MEGGWLFFDIMTLPMLICAVSFFSELLISRYFSPVGCFCNGGCLAYSPTWSGNLECHCLLQVALKTLILQVTVWKSSVMKEWLELEQSIRTWVQRIPLDSGQPSALRYLPLYCCRWYFGSPSPTELIIESELSTYDEIGTERPRKDYRSSSARVVLVLVS